MDQVADALERNEQVWSEVSSFIPPINSFFFTFFCLNHCSGFRRINHLFSFLYIGLYLGCPGVWCIRAQRASVKCHLLYFPLSFLDLSLFELFCAFIYFHSFFGFYLGFLQLYVSYKARIYWAWVGSTAHAQQNCKLLLVCCRCSGAP